jgi:tRNA A58 N-methylase Trm61
MIQGQMLPNSLRGKAIKDIINQNAISTIVEIGTWKGLGSTKCIIDAMRSGIKFISIESNLEFHKIAIKNLSKYSNKVELLHGTIVNEEDLNIFVSDKELNIDQKQWLKDDILNLKHCENILSKIPSSIDFLLLDGGEFSTYSEWLTLKDRTHIVALDDISELKSFKIHNELLSNESYELIFLTEEGNGFSIFKKIN